MAQKDVHAKEPVAQKDVLECHAMPYYLKNTTLLLVCSWFSHFSPSEDLQQINTSIFNIYSYHIYLFLPLMLLSKCLKRSSDWSPPRHDDLQPLGACHFCSIKRVISLERDANRELQSAVQHLAESSPSASKLPRFFAKGRNVRKKNIGYILRAIWARDDWWGLHALQRPQASKQHFFHPKMTCTKSHMDHHGSCCSERLHPREFGV